MVIGGSACRIRTGRCFNVLLTTVGVCRAVVLATGDRVGIGVDVAVLKPTHVGLVACQAVSIQNPQHTIGVPVVDTACNTGTIGNRRHSARIPGTVAHVETGKIGAYAPLAQARRHVIGHIDDRAGGLKMKVTRGQLKQGTAAQVTGTGAGDAVAVAAGIVAEAGIGDGDGGTAGIQKRDPAAAGGRIAFNDVIGQAQSIHNRIDVDTASRRGGIGGVVAIDGVAGDDGTAVIHSNTATDASGRVIANHVVGDGHILFEDGDSTTIAIQAIAIPDRMVAFDNVARDGLPSQRLGGRQRVDRGDAGPLKRLTVGDGKP